MAEFTVSGNITQSADGTTETFNDTSNYSSNDDGVTLNNLISRVVTVYDPDVYNTGTMNPSLLTYDVAVTQDLALTYVIVYTLADTTTRTLIISYLSTQFYNILQRTLANQLSCNCCKGNLCTDMVKARELWYAAITSNLLGDNGTAQADITAANTLLNSNAYNPC